MNKSQLIRELVLITGAKTLCVENVLQGMNVLAREELGRGSSFRLPGLVTLTPHLRRESPPRRKNVAGVMRDVPSKPRRFQVKAKASNAITYLPVPAPDEVLDEERILGPEAHAEDRLHAEVVAALERSGQRQRQEQLSKRQRAEETVPVSSDASTSD